MRIAATVITFAVSGFISATLQADIPERYQTIVDRNSFGLNPPPPPAPEGEQAPVPPVNVKLTGFATINGKKKAYFTVPPKDPAKEPQLYLGLGEGDRQDALEVISISDQDGEVRVRNSGVEMVLSLKNNGFKPATLAPGVAVAPTPGGMPQPNPGGAPVSPVYNPANSSAVVSDYAKMAQPNPNPVPNPSGGQPQPQVQPNANPPDGGMRSIPTRTLRLNPQNAGTPQSYNTPVVAPVYASYTPESSPVYQAPVYQPLVSNGGGYQPASPPSSVGTGSLPPLTFGNNPGPLASAPTPSTPVVDPVIQAINMEAGKLITLRDKLGRELPTPPMPSMP